MSLSIRKKLGIALLVGFIAGVLWLVAIRYITSESDETHYHANFAVYINGERLPFDNPTFYEEVQSCGGDELFNPKIRVHLHDRISHVVHVHDAGSTWGHLFLNLGYTLGNDLLATDTEVFTEEEGELTFILNGNKTSSISNQTIRSEDALVIWYETDNSESEEVQAEAGPSDPQQAYEALQKDAAEYNTRQDPSACTGGKQITPAERLKQAVGVF